MLMLKNFEIYGTVGYFVSKFILNVSAQKEFWRNIFIQGNMEDTQLSSVRPVDQQRRQLADMKWSVERFLSISRYFYCTIYNIM